MNAVYQALSDPTRREVLAPLRRRPRTSGEVAEAFPFRWPSVSRHLAILRDAGLIVAERNGQHIRYEINTSVLQDLVQHFLGLVEQGGQSRDR
jgi:ArsR family transcriptional regulator